jgi:hypothetical protein
MRDQRADKSKCKNLGRLSWRGKGLEGRGGELGAGVEDGPQRGHTVGQGRAHTYMMVT